jgi:hypothetical protein
MRRNKNVRKRIVPSAIEDDLRRADPALAAILDTALTEHLCTGTRGAYDSATSAYVEFLHVRGNPHPFPVNRSWLAAFMVYKIHFIGVESLKAYLSGIRHAHELTGARWLLEGDPIIHKVWRFLKKKHGTSPGVAKFPMTLSMILACATYLPGWPQLERMSHNDRTWLTASVIGTLGFLRGGEFMVSPKPSRPLLRSCDVFHAAFAGKSAVVVKVRRPKGTWWERSMDVRCFSPSSAHDLDPVTLLATLRRLAPAGAEFPEGPAFFTGDGKALSKVWMLARTSALLVAAGILLFDSLGRAVFLRASSWRCGGVESAKAAGISDSLIMTMGRWSSNAWLAYSSIASPLDFQGATAQMWAAATRGPGGRMVVSSDLSSFDVLESEIPTESDLTVRQPRPVGSIINTRWGPAKIIEIIGYDHFTCSLPGDPQRFDLELVDFSGDEAAYEFGPFSVVQ